MSRTSWVAAAIIRARNNDGATACENARTLATEVERLEKKNFALQWESAKLKARVETAEADSARHKRNEELQMTRAIKAEARAKELEAQNARLLDEDRIGWLEQQREEECKQKEAALKESEMCLKETKQLREQNAKLRAALEVELAENQVLKFGTPTGAFEIFATKQSWRLKAALNGEEAST